LKENELILGKEPTTVFGSAASQARIAIVQCSTGIPACAEAEMTQAGMPALPSLAGSWDGWWSCRAAKQLLESCRILLAICFAHFQYLPYLVHMWYPVLFRSKMAILIE
jgi:hypothetical protein